MSFSWVCWISVPRGWVRWRWEEGQEESEVIPALRSLAVACSLGTTGISLTTVPSAEGKDWGGGSTVNLPCGETAWVWA